MTSRGKSQHQAIKMEAVLAVHRLNTCFLAARSYSHAVGLAERAAWRDSVYGAVTGSTRAVKGGTQPAAATSSSPTSATPSQQPTSSAGHCLLQALTEMLNIGEPHAVLALNCLSYLSCSPRVVQEVMDAAGLLPLLLGQLRHGSALEPALQVSSLRLVLTLVQSSLCGTHRAGPAQQRYLTSLASVAALFLRPGQQTACLELALCLLEELVLTRAGARELRSHTALNQSMHLMLAPVQPDLPKHFCKRLASVQKLAATLAPSQVTD